MDSRNKSANDDYVLCQIFAVIAALVAAIHWNSMPERTRVVSMAASTRDDITVAYGFAEPAQV
jgi:hypothetical protein